MKNVLSQALENGIYPKSMVISREQVIDIVADFRTGFPLRFDTFKTITTFDYAFYFEAYYNTKKGVQKKCLVLVEKK